MDRQESLHRRLLYREQGCSHLSDTSSAPERPLSFLQRTRGDPALIRRLKQTLKLLGHKGAVNTLAWNSAGTLLASGCDDCRIKIWDASRACSVRTIESGHTQSIYCLGFLPETNDSHIISCSADRQVRLIDLNKQAVRPFHCHHGRVKCVAAVGPDVFLSGGEDGMVCQFDKRVQSICSLHNRHRSPNCNNLLVEQRTEHASGRSQATVGVNSLAVDPLQPHMFATGGFDPIVRLFDRRMIRSPTSSSPSRLQKTPWLACFIPPHFKSDYAPFYNSTGRQHPITSVAFSYNGTNLVASYSSEHIYSFSVADHALELTSTSGERLYGGQPRLQLRKQRLQAMEEVAYKAKCSSNAALSCEIEPSSSGASNAAAAGHSEAPGCQDTRKRSHHDAIASDAGPSSIYERSSRPRTFADNLGGTRVSQTDRTSRLSLGDRPLLSERAAGAHPFPQGVYTEASFLGQTIPLGIETSQDATSLSLNMVLPISLSMMSSPDDRQRLQQAAAGPAAELLSRSTSPGDRMPDVPGQPAGTSGAAASREQGVGGSASPSNNGEASPGMRLSQWAARLGVNNMARGGPTAGGGSPGLDSARRAQAAQPRQPTTPDGGSLFDRLIRPVFGMDRSTSSERSPSSSSPSMQTRSQRRLVWPPPTPQGRSSAAATSRRFPQSRVDALQAGVPGSSMSSPASPSVAPASRHLRTTRVGAAYQDDTRGAASGLADMPSSLFRRCYKGHRHLTATKDVTLMGGRSEYVVSGSDEGNIFIWDFETGEIVNVLFAGETAINGLASHPWDPMLASSNAEDVIQLWSPEADGPPRLENLNSLLRLNAQEMADGDRPRHTAPVLMNVLQAMGSMGDMESPPAQGQSPMRCAIQ